MWSTIANLKENLNKIALVVHDDDDEMLRMYGGKSTTNGVESRVSDRRNSNRFLRSKSGIRSPLTNGIDHVSISEIEQYKAEIKRLQASEAEIKALSVNYAALLKDKEGQNVRLNKENGSLKQDLEAANAALSASRNEGSRASTSGTSSVKELANSVDGKIKLSKAVQYSSEIRKLKLELKQERDQLANIQLNFREEQESNNSFREELKMLKLEREKTSKELRKVQYELNVKASEIKHLRFELTRRKNEEAEEDFDSLKRLIKTLEKENNTLKIERNEIEAAFEKSRKSFTEKMLSDALHIQKTDSSSTSDIPDHSESFPGKEEMERSLQKLNKDLKETQRDRDKALQELSRLKQHLLQKDADQRADVSKAEKEEILVKLSLYEEAQTELKSRVRMLEDDNSRLRRAVEQSMTGLNRMSVDSDYLVDRRIVIKLLVTYFRRNHSREVIDLMVRMLGFSDEDKQRISVAQQGASKGVVQGVLRLPGRLVGGILGGSSTEVVATAGSDHQSFADMWIDFLLKETEEREKRETSGNTDTTTENSHDKSSNTISAIPPRPNPRFASVPPLSNPRFASAFPIISTNQNISLLPPNYFQRPENFGSEFSTVPLTPSIAKSTGSNQLPILNIDTESCT